MRPPAIVAPSDMPTPADAFESTVGAYKAWSDKERSAGIRDGTIDPDTGWPTEKGLTDAARQYAGAMLGSTVAPGSGTTQIAGTTSMYRKAIEHLLNKTPHAKAVLDYGAGLGLGADAMRDFLGDRATVHTLEPSPERWRGKQPPTYTDDGQIRGKYDIITNTNVLNVLPKDIRDGVVQDIGAKLAPGGRALITTRGWSGDIAATKNAEPGEEPRSIYVKRGDQRVFQRGFEPQELIDYIGKSLGDGFTVERAPGFGKAAALITRQPPALP